MHKQISIFKDTTMDSFIPMDFLPQRKLKYKLHYGEVRRDVLTQPHGT